MSFWIPVGLATILAIVWTLRPLLKRAETTPAVRASYDIQIYKDQLKEIDADTRRGIMTASEAERIRTEVSRRLLAAAQAEDAAKPAPDAPRTATFFLMATIIAAASFGGLSVYYFWGFPGLRDLPYAENLAQQAAANRRPSQAEAEAVILAEQEKSAGLPRLESLTQSREAALLAELAKVLEDRPDDLEGHRLLASNLAASGRFIEAHAAQDKVLEILGDSATPEDHLNHAELMILAVQGYVSRDAIEALDIVMDTIPENPRARYYAGLALAQYNQPREAYFVWNQLLREGPEDAPWIPAIRASIGDLAVRAGVAPGGAPGDAPGPTAEQIEDAASLSNTERADMISAMVMQLSERLEAEGGTIDEWLRLIGAYVVLDRHDAARAALAKARTAFAENPEALERLAAAEAQIP